MTHPERTVRPTQRFSIVLWRRPHPWPWRHFVYLPLYLVYVSACMWLLSIPLEQAADAWQVGTITQLLGNQRIYGVLGGIVLKGALVLLAAAVAGFVFRSPLYALGCVFLALAGPFAAVAMDPWVHASTWTDHGRVTTPDGETYVFMDSSFLQGQTMAIARLRHEDATRRVVETLGTTNGDSPRSWASVIRPGDSPDGYGQLYRSGCGLIVGLRSDNHAYLAYDPVGHRFYGHGAIESLSPFLLLGAGDSLNQKDVAALRQLLRERPAAGPGTPSEAALRDGLEHPNQEVRALASELIETRAAQSALATPAPTTTRTAPRAPQPQNSLGDPCWG
jgi:hypothetical protein